MLVHFSREVAKGFGSFQVEIGRADENGGGKDQKAFIAWMALRWSVLGVSVAMKNWVEAMIDADKYLNVKPSPASNERGIKVFLIGLLEVAETGADQDDGQHVIGSARWAWVMKSGLRMVMAVANSAHRIGSIVLASAYVSGPQNAAIRSDVTLPITTSCSWSWL